MELQHLMDSGLGMLRRLLMKLMQPDYSALLMALVWLSQPPYKTLYRTRDMA
jgi:hypothetical protein